MISPGRLIAAAALFAAAALGLAQEMPWTKTWAEASRKAQSGSRLVMIDFWADWCGPCRMMKATTLKDAGVVRASRALIPLSLDAERGGRSLAEKYAITGFPTFLFVDAKGEEFGRVTGGMGADQFVKLVNSMVDRHARFKSLAARTQRSRTDGQAFAGLAEINAERGRAGTAEAQAKRAAQLGFRGPELARAWLALGNVSGRNGRSAEALVFFDRSVKAGAKGDTLVRARMGLAAANFDLGRRTEAVSQARLAAQTKGASPQMIQNAQSMLREIQSQG